MDVRDEIARVGEGVRARFEAEKRVLSFEEYLEEVAEHPQRHLRDAARYLGDAIEHFGSRVVERPWGKVRRWNVFDLDFGDSPAAEVTGSEEHARRERLAGHEQLQANAVAALRAFRREGRANRLLLLHGPNGSAKSTFARCLQRGLESYSQTDAGALYRFSWVFPRGEKGSGIGFRTDAAALPQGESYAKLPEERIDAKLASEIREHPLLLLPRAERRALLERLLRERGEDPDDIPDLLFHGDLGHKNRQIHDALLTAYRGDLSRVFAHVQVERWYISRRYRVGTVTIGPQMAVDARERQITADRSLGSLPASLSAQTLFESFGELVDAAGGLVEYSDLLKRPLDAWRYLLLAIESGEVALPMSNLPINSVMVASSNELHLRAFQEHPEYASFRGRLVLLRAGYLRDYRQEQDIYDAQIVPQVRVPVAPHTTYVAALWATLTRLRRAKVSTYEDRALGRLAAELTPLEKAELYADGLVPRRLDSDDANVLAAGIEAVYHEPTPGPAYEGGVGASAREMRMILLAAAGESGGSLTPAGVLEQIVNFCKREDYDFLSIDADHGYHDAVGFAAIVRERWFERVNDELRAATGLAQDSQVVELFGRYINHASHALNNQQIHNPHTGRHEDPDASLLERVEEMLGLSGDPLPHRRELISRVANWALDNPDAEIDYAKVFKRQLEQLEDAYYEEHRKQIGEIARDVVRVIDGDPSLVEEAPRAAADTCREQMNARFGYEDVTLRVALGELVRARYADL